MWNKSIGIIFLLLKIACVSIRGDNDQALGSVVMTTQFNPQASWYAASKFCTNKGMRLATITLLDDHQYIESLIRDKHISDEQFWISKSVMAAKKASKWMQVQAKFPTLQKSSNQCISWYWMNVELCFALWPLENEWNHEDCAEERYFICEDIHESEKEIFTAIEDELLTLADELMFTGFADALPTTTENEWTSLVQGALQTWLNEQQQQTPKPITTLDEQVHVIAAELTDVKQTFDTDELKQFVYKKFETMNAEDQFQLLSERFRNFIGDEYMNLGTGTQWTKLPSDSDIDALVKKVVTLVKVQQIKLASEEMAKLSTKPTDVLDEDFMQTISQQLLKFSEKEFESYVIDMMAQLENYGVEEIEMNMLLQLYLLLKQELYSLIAKTVLKATSKERIEITNYGLSRILEGKQLIGEESVFGQIFEMLAAGTAVLAEDRTVPGLDDVLIRTFVKKEIQNLRHEDLLKLKYEGYIKFVIDEVIKLVADINSAKSDTGEVLLNNVVDLIASQFLFYAEDELKTVAQRLSASIKDESDKLQSIVEEMKIKFNDEDKFLKLVEFVQRELLIIIVKSLTNFNEKEMLTLAEEALTKILAENEPTLRSSTLGKVFLSIGDELLIATNHDFAVINDEVLEKFVKSKVKEANYEKNADLFEAMYMSLITEEFIKLVDEEAIIISAAEEEKHPFGEMVRLIAVKLREIANDDSVYIENSLTRWLKEKYVV